MARESVSAEWSQGWRVFDAKRVTVSTAASSALRLSSEEMRAVLCLGVIH
jgi:hypothetical protein